MGEVIAHVITKLPHVFFVNWFRKSDDGRWLWPGFGDNSRVLKWICERVEGTGQAVETPIGHIPAPEALDLAGLELDPDDLKELLAVDVQGWKHEVADVEKNYAKFGDRLPPALTAELDKLRKRLAE